MSFMTAGIDHTWVRLKPDPAFGNLAGLFTTEIEWHAQGHNLADVGLLPLGHGFAQAQAGIDVGPQQIPECHDLLIDLHTTNEIRIVQIPPGASSKEPPVLVAADFTDPHPPLWVQQLAQEQRGVLAVGPKGPGAFSTQAAWMATWQVGIVGVARRLDMSGVGVVPASVCSICGAFDPHFDLISRGSADNWQLCDRCAREARRGRTKRLAAASHGYRSEAEIADRIQRAGLE
jgi:hypothetical protein